MYIHTLLIHCIYLPIMVAFAIVTFFIRTMVAIFAQAQSGSRAHRRPGTQVGQQLWNPKGPTGHRMSQGLWQHMVPLWRYE